MASYSGEYTFEVVDVNGDTATLRIKTFQVDTRTFAQMATTVGNLATAIAAVTNGNGERGSLTIPAPLESVFGAASNVVDSTNANVAALIALIEADMVGPS